MVDVYRGGVFLLSIWDAKILREAVELADLLVLELKEFESTFGGVDSL